MNDIEVQMIQLKWSDETEWKNYERLGRNDPEVRIAELKASWAAEKAKHKLKHDAEFRIIPVKVQRDPQLD